MKVYHGTTSRRWKTISKTGILPRAAGVSSNWKHSVESSKNNVYMTDAYAPYFSLAALREVGNKFEDLMIIEFDTDHLDRSLLLADEDALEQFSRDKVDGLEHLTMHERTREYIKNAKKFSKLGFGFHWSMDVMGTGAYAGRIPPKAFTRVASFDAHEQQKLCFEFMDAQVSVMNYRYLGGKYRALTNMIFGDTPTAEDLANLEMFAPHFKMDRDGIAVDILNY